MEEEHKKMCRIRLIDGGSERMIYFYQTSDRALSSIGGSITSEGFACRFNFPSYPKNIAFYRVQGQ